MTGGSLGLGIRSGSYGSLDKQLQNGVSPILIVRKPSKMLKEKEKFLHWICKFAGRKKVGMLILSLISAAVFIWVLYVGKVGLSSIIKWKRQLSEYQSIDLESFCHPSAAGEDAQEGDRVQNLSLNDSLSLINPESSPMYGVQRRNITSLNFQDLPMPPTPPAFFLGYTLPPGHPCNSFTLPPPPVDKKRTGPRPCSVCYLPVEEAIALMPKVPSPSPVLKNLTYIYEENLSRETEFGGSDFGGYPTLKQREDSYDIRESMNVHCGFVSGGKPGRNTGYDMDEDDLLDMEQCHGVVVASAIFGNFDEINQPRNISEYSKQTVCFYMFIDEATEAYLKKSGTLDGSKKVGMWRIVVVRNHPYEDARRTGKIPKLLMHRMFPNARFSLWIDGKLELVVDPFQVLERFLWRKNATFAISRHYRRFDVFVEAEANKAAGKYDNASIDFQIEFYKKEGLTPYSEEKLPITSDVPEGCVIIKEHVPISNMLTCLWFNEVDRFTSRDQISFSTVRDRINAKTNYTINMFLDCERRNFVVQKYHRDVLKRLAPQIPVLISPPPPPLPPATLVDAPLKRIPQRRGRYRRSSSRRHRKVVAGDREVESS